MARSAFAGFMDAGSVVVATTSVTMSLSLSLSLSLSVFLSNLCNYKMRTVQNTNHQFLGNVYIKGGKKKLSAARSFGVGL